MAEKARSIRVRLSEGEWQSVKDRAAALGCSASSYVRHAVAAYALASDEAGGVPMSPSREFVSKLHPFLHDPGHARPPRGRRRRGAGPLPGPRRQAR